MNEHQPPERLREQLAALDERRAHVQRALAERGDDPHRTQLPPIRLTKSSMIKVGSFNVNIGRLFFATIFLLITILFMNSSFFIFWQQYYYLILSGIIGLVIGDYGMLKSYEIIGPRLGMLMMSFVPTISVVLAYFFLDEVLSKKRKMNKTMLITTMNIMRSISLVLVLIIPLLIFSQDEENCKGLEYGSFELYENGKWSVVFSGSSRSTSNIYTDTF